MAKTLKFRPNLAELILAGEKTTTWRLFDDKDLSEGDKLDLINKETGQMFAHAAISSVREKTLGEVEDTDFDEGHERYESEEAMYEAYRSYYGDQVGPDTPLKIVSFSLQK